MPEPTTEKDTMVILEESDDQPLMDNFVWPGARLLILSAPKIDSGFFRSVDCLPQEPS